MMEAQKEKPDGSLTNEEIEKELSRKEATGAGGRNYTGAQDTGEQTIRSLGTDVQQNDGLPKETEKGKDE